MLIFKYAYIHAFISVNHIDLSIIIYLSHSNYSSHSEYNTPCTQRIALMDSISLINATGIKIGTDNPTSYVATEQLWYERTNWSWRR
jgi:hypothetical protein